MENMATKEFLFDGHISDEEYKPFVPWDAFKDLPENTILFGVVDHILPGDYPKAMVLINGHLCGVTVWGTDALGAAAAFVGRSTRVRFKCMNSKGYPDLQMMI